MHKIRFQLLGPVEMWDGAGVLPAGGLKQRTVLAILLLNNNRVVAEETLTALTWGDSPPAGVRGQLQLYVSRLRGLLGKPAIVRRAAGYRIQVDPGALDVDHFDELTGLARSAPDAATASAHLRAALALWQGPGLGGTSEPLLRRERPVLEERRSSAWEDLFEAEMAMDRHSRILGDLHRLTEDNPFRETFHAQLMRALHGSGRIAEAIATYTALRVRLARELGVDPAPSLQDLYRQIISRPTGGGTLRR